MNGYDQRANIIIDFLKIYNDKDSITGVEIGVYEGDLICALLNLEPRISKIYGIDPYCIESGYRRRWNQSHWNRLFVKALGKLEKYKERVTLIRDRSEFAECVIPMVDFVEVDGLHTYEQTSKDIKIYEKKVNNGGLLCGHDYFGPFSKSVRRAVDRYAKSNDRKLHEEESAGMWWWRVP
jgi:hypothetical protein